MTTNSITPFSDSSPVWQVGSTRNGNSVDFTVSISDSDDEATAQEQDDAVNALAASLAGDGFTITSKTRYNVSSTTL